MGRRHARHSFMPETWVFPGGRVDRADFRAPFATDLSHDAAATFQAHGKGPRGRALAMAAVRETFEEAGLLLAKPAPPRPAAGPWRDFLALGAQADLEAMEIIARAITPPMIGKRFDTWFLMAEAERLISLEPEPDCGELEEIAWFSFDDALGLNLPAITRTVVKEAALRLEEPGRPRPFVRFRNGGFRAEHL